MSIFDTSISYVHLKCKVINGYHYTTIQQSTNESQKKTQHDITFLNPFLVPFVQCKMSIVIN